MSNGLDFERQVHALLKKMGFEAEVTRASGDGGIDIIAHSREHITGGKYIVQCKDWSSPVGEPPVRDLYGVVTAENANKGILITTSTFTAPALKFAEGKPLELIDGTKFSILLKQYNLGLQNNISFKDERIKELTEQLNSNPKNIFILKELADIYLLKEDYEKAAEYYEKLINMKPTVETEGLRILYNYGLNSYGVALAMLKRYDEALKIFKENHIKFQEGRLAHYLGLYDIAISIYQEANSSTDDNHYDKDIEKAYVQAQSDDPALSALVDGTAYGFPLETALQKAKVEGKRSMYTPIATAAFDIFGEFGESWAALKSNIVADQIHSSSEDNEEVVDLSFDDSLVDLKNRCSKLIADSKDILNISPVNSLQEAYREDVARLIALVSMIYESILSYIKFVEINTGRRTWIANQIGLLECIDSCTSAFNDKMSEYKSLEQGFVEEEIKFAAKWEEVLNKEKTEWREKILKTVYSNWSPDGQNKQCFIATTVYGSAFAPEVEMLRQWRDQRLSKTSLGRRLISIYYRHSPYLAKYLEHRQFLKMVIRKFLNCIVRRVGHQTPPPAQTPR